MNKLLVRSVVAVVVGIGVGYVTWPLVQPFVFNQEEFPQVLQPVEIPCVDEKGQGICNQGLVDFTPTPQGATAISTPVIGKNCIDMTLTWPENQDLKGKCLTWDALIQFDQKTIDRWWKDLKAPNFPREKAQFLSAMWNVFYMSQSNWDWRGKECVPMDLAWPGPSNPYRGKCLSKVEVFAVTLGQVAQWRQALFAAGQNPNIPDGREFLKTEWCMGFPQDPMCK